MTWRKSSSSWIGHGRGGKEEALRILYRINHEYFSWNGCCYAPVSEGFMRAYLYEQLANALRKDDDGPINPDKAGVSRVEDALRARAHYDGNADRDFWIGADADDCYLISVRNGLLDPSERKLIPHTPRYFTRNTIPIEYRHKPKCLPVEFLKFLDSIWPDDQDSIRLLQQFFGYCLSNRTDIHKIMLIVGPPRSGKGTIAGVLTKLLGAANVAGPTLADFVSPFGMAQLLGKKLAIVGDARFAGRADQLAQVASRLLSISGGDILTVDRKFAVPWIGRINAKIMICSNEVPRLSDSSGALAGRFLTLQMRHSHAGAEDLGLAERLNDELREILNWALDGLEDLNTEGRFVQPVSSEEIRHDLGVMASPVSEFVSECCVLEEGAWVLCSVLFTAWQDWCTAQGRDRTGTQQLFGRDLKAACPGVQTNQDRSGILRGKRRYLGIRLCHKHEGG